MKVKNICVYVVCSCVAFGAFAGTDIDLVTYCTGKMCDLTGGVYFNDNNIPYDVVSDYYVKDGTHSVIKNTKTIEGTIHVCSGCELLQLIEAPEDITSLNVDSAGVFTVSVVGNGISLNDIAKNIKNSDVLQLAKYDKSVQLTLGANYNSANLQNTAIIINGDVWITVSDDFKTDGNPVLYNVKDGHDKLHFDFNTDNPSYALAVKWDGNKLYLIRTITTNYEQVFVDSRGMFLNYLRETGSDNDLINKLDAENDMNRLMDILSKSVRLNPELLMRSVHEINMLEITSGSVNQVGMGISIEPIYMFSNHGNTIGGRLAAKYSVTDSLYIGASGYGYKIRFDDGLNKYDSGVYGGNVRIDYIGDIVFVRGGLGGNIDSFDTGPLLNGNEITHNPTGNSLYGFVDLGKHFNIGNDGWYVAPFVNVSMERLHILQNNKNDFFARGAFDGGYSFVLDSMKYTYNLRAGVNTLGNIDAAFNVDAWSEIDGAGGNISLGLIQTELGMSGKASINLQIVF